MMDTLQSLLDTSFLTIPLMQWLAAIMVLFMTFVLQSIIVKHVFRFLTQRMARQSKTTLDTVLFKAAEKPANGFILLLGMLLAVHILSPTENMLPLVRFTDQMARVAIIFVGVWFLWRLLDGLTIYFGEQASHTETTLDDQLIPFIAKTLKAFLVITGILVMAQNMGYSISGLLASLGIGGIAVAMAARDSIANIFGSIMILIDRPFMVGDWIKTNDFEGVVEEVGFRSTRIRTFEKTLVNVPNSQLANMVIDNIDARSVRRIKMRIGLTYATTPEQMQLAIAGIEHILETHPGVDQEFKLVKFDEFADSSLSIFLYYFSASKAWGEYLAVRQDVNLKIMSLLESLNLDFAFPSRSVYMHDMDKQA